ncbi:MAG: SapC family protein [Candidatus Competibacteraceae bacterium]|nr:SapC family protein [Candidatus Competibacteraceae bacterium]MCP5126609.1 SapC family protein [Gammaproteobacteria bacterium]
MPAFAALSRERHAHQGWKRHTSYTFTAKEAVVPLVGAELPKVLPSMPIAFIQEQTHYQLVGVLSLQPGSNLLVSASGQWLGPYIPVAWRTYPFRVLRPQGSEQSVLCVDEDSGLIIDAANADERFFNDQGDPGVAIRDILNFLTQVEANRVATQRGVDALARVGIIEQWPLQVDQAGQMLSVTGLYRINEVALNALDDQVFLELRQHQSLPVAYAQLLSMNQLTVLERLSQMQARRAEQIQAQQQANSLGDLDSFGLTQEDGILRFD